MPAFYLYLFFAPYSAKVRVCKKNINYIKQVGKDYISLILYTSGRKTEMRSTEGEGGLQN